MKLLVTGGAGFIGSAVIRRAIGLGHHVLNLDILTYAANLANVKTVSEDPRYSFARIDICDPAPLTRALSDFAPDAIIHLAAESHVDRSIDSPASFIDTNIRGTFNVLQAARSYLDARKSGTEFKFLHVSTDEVFGSLPPDANSMFTEDSSYAPRSPYSASKAAADHLVRAWFSTYDLPTIVTNCSNNYGPYQFPEKLIPVTILNALHGSPIPVYGNGAQVRDWLHVEDHADALLNVVVKGIAGKSYNIGARCELRNIDLVHSVCAILDQKRPRKTGQYAELIEFVRDRPGHDRRYAIDPSQTEKKLGWKARTSINDGLESTVDWYLENEAWWQPLLQRDGVGARLGLLQ
ncbi:CDP-paratose 2-epimerase [Altererythrobacter insulae]|nr:CDP-paratose 2-epimerase [Altererythrobacter insulae]